MTWWREVAVAHLLGGISTLLGGTTPAAPPPPPTPPADPRELLTPEQKAQLTYAGVDPASAPIGEIDRVLRGLGEKPLAPPPPPAPPRPDPATVGPPPPGDGLSGAATDAAARIDDALRNDHTALNDADAQLADAILRATSSDQAGKARLQGLQQEVVDEVTNLGPTLDTPSGQAQLADFLQGKTAEVLDVVRAAGLDSASHAAVLEALTARYQALGDLRQDRGDETRQGEPVTVSPSAPPDQGQLAPDPFMAGLVPETAALGGLPSLASGGFPQLGSMMPPFGAPLSGGLPTSDLGSSIGSAIRDALHDKASDDKPPPLKDAPVTNNESAWAHETGAPAPLKQEISQTPKPPAGPQSPPTPGPPDTTVKLPDGTSVTAASPAVAAAGRSVLAGTPIADAYQQAGVTLPPPGSAVTDPVSPSQLMFGDVGEFTDHRVMALGGGKVFVNGQVCALEQLDTGPNFLGWDHPSTAVANGR